MPCVMADPGCLFLRFPHQFHLLVEQLFIDLQKLFLRLVIVFIAQVDVEMEDGVLEDAYEKEDHKGAHHIENGKSLKIRPVGHNSPGHDGHEQRHGAEQIHLFYEEIHAV